MKKVTFRFVEHCYNSFLLRNKSLVVLGTKLFIAYPLIMWCAHYFTGVLHTIWGDDITNPDRLSSPAASLRKWMRLLPQPIAQQVNLALGQESPFMPPDVTPEVMAEPNTAVPSMNHIEIIYVSGCCRFQLWSLSPRKASCNRVTLANPSYFIKCMLDLFMFP